jgi:hypothetical protein
MAAAFARKRGVADDHCEREKQCYGGCTHGFMLHRPGCQRGDPAGYTGPLFRLLPHDPTASAHGPTPPRFRPGNREQRRARLNTGHRSNRPTVRAPSSPGR